MAQPLLNTQYLVIALWVLNIQQKPRCRHPGRMVGEEIGMCSSSSSLVAKLCSTLAAPWIVACQAPLSVGFSRQEYWSGLPFPSPCVVVMVKETAILIFQHEKSEWKIWKTEKKKKLKEATNRIEKMITLLGKGNGELKTILLKNFYLF